MNEFSAIVSPFLPMFHTYPSALPRKSSVNLRKDLDTTAHHNVPRDYERSFATRRTAFAAA